MLCYVAIWGKKEQTVRTMRCRFQYGVAVKCEPKQYEQKLAKEKDRWTPSFGQGNAEIKLGSQALLD